jgi:hypothetical protein
MIQLQQARLKAVNMLSVSVNMNFMLTNEEAEIGAASAEDLGKI